MSPLEIEIPARLRQPLKWVGYPLFAVAVFNLSVYASLPRERIKERFETVVGETLGADVNAKELGLTLLSGPGLTASEVELKTRAASATEKPQRYVIDDLTLHFSPYQLLRGNSTTSFVAHLAEGVASGKYRFVPEEASLAVEASGISLKAFPGLPSLLAMPGVPLEGTVDLNVDVTLPKSMIAEAEGAVTIACEDVVLGDGKSKLTVAGNPYLSSGLTVPKIKLGKITFVANVSKGRMVLKEVKTHSSDLDVAIEGYVDLKEPLSASQLHIFIKMKPSDALLRREPALDAVVGVAGSQAKRTDGYYGIAVTGAMSSAMVMPSKEAPAGVGRNSPPPIAPPVRPSPAHFASPVPGIPAKAPPVAPVAPVGVEFPVPPSHTVTPAAPPPPPPPVVAPAPVPPPAAPVPTPVAPPTPPTPPTGDDTPPPSGPNIPPSAHAGRTHSGEHPSDVPPPPPDDSPKPPTEGNPDPNAPPPVAPAALPE